MTYHDKDHARAAKAIGLAGAHFRKKDGDQFDALGAKMASLTDATMKRLDDTDLKVNEVHELAFALDQKMARMDSPFGRQAGGKGLSWGAQFTEADGLKGFADDETRPARFKMAMKSTLTSDAASGGGFDIPARDQPSLMPKRRMTIRNLLPVVQITSNSIEYVNQTGQATGATTVAEAALKPEATLTFSLETVKTQVIAHWLPASRHILSDVPQLRDVIDTELRYGLMMAEEVQILSGDGTGSNLSGLIPNATAFSDPLTQANPTMLDTIGAAILQNALADFPADGIVMHPSDWMKMRLLKDGDGHYVLGDPQAAIEARLFGLPVVPTQAMAAGSFLVGNFQAAATIYDRWDARVEVSTEHADFFTRNLVAVLAEERLGLAVKHPEALTYGSFA